MNSNVTEITDDAFEAEVLQSDQPVLVDFWAAWCAPGRLVAPALEETAALFEGRVVNEIKQIGGQAEYFLSDVSKEAYAKVTVEFTVKTFGKLYPAFNNAGIEGEFKPIHEQTEPKPPRWNPPRFRQLLQ